MDDQEKRQLMESLLSEVQIYEERQPNGQWLKSIKFKLPIIAEDMSLSLDNDAHMETVVLMSRKDNKCQKAAYFRAFSEVGNRSLTPEKARLFYMETYLLQNVCQVVTSD